MCACTSPPLNSGECGLPFSKPMIEMLFSLRLAPRVFEKRLPIRRLWSYETDRPRAVSAAMSQQC